MYNPPRFKSTDRDEAWAVMARNPFATVITVSKGLPVVSHLPLVPKRNGDDIELIGHLARANPQWKTFENAEATAIFHGPHCYISPKWYENDDVPTWNYISLHATGPIELIQDQAGIADCLRDLVRHVEALWPSGWEFWILEDLQGPLLAENIVGFKLRIRDMNCKKKLGQNRSLADQQGVLRGLESRTDENSRNIQIEMRKLMEAKRG